MEFQAIPWMGHSINSQIGENEQQRVLCGFLQPTVTLLSCTSCVEDCRQKDEDIVI
jgi:hypothetical protein